jgi:hypothetical protein
MLEYLPLSLGEKQKRGKRKTGKKISKKKEKIQEILQIKE